MESDATWWLESPDGLEIGGGGLSATLRDDGRFGLFLMNGGVVEGEKILPAGWVKDAGSSKTIGGKNVDYGYTIWPFSASAGARHLRATYLPESPRACRDPGLGRTAQAHRHRDGRG